MQVGTDGSMERRPGITGLAGVDDPEPPPQPRKPVLIPVDPAPTPRTAPPQTAIPKAHSTEVGKIGNSRMAGGDRGIKRDRPDNDDKMFHLDRKKKIKIDGAIGIDQPISEQNPIDTGRSADTRQHLIRCKQYIQNRSTGDADHVVLEKKLASPPALQIATEHPQRKHVEQDVKNSAMEKLIGQDLPQIEVVPEKVRDQTKKSEERGIEKSLQEKYRNIGDDQSFDGKGKRSTAERHAPCLIKHNR